MMSSKGFVLVMILVLGVFLSGVAAIGANVAHGSSAGTAMTAEQALNTLMEGNARFVSGNVLHPNQSDEQQAKVVSGQEPFAVVVSCSDSRVPPEILFDQGIGDIFVVRTAGEVMDNATVGSIEYAVEHLHVPLIVVLGHDDCGAVNAAVNGGTEPGQINYLVNAIKPAVDTAKGMQGDLLSNAINENTKDVVAQLESTQPILHEHVKGGNLLVVPARYHLDTGAVELLGNASEAQNTACDFAAMAVLPALQ
jgi:carbonic anhydrase